MIEKISNKPFVIITTFFATGIIFSKIFDFQLLEYFAIFTITFIFLIFSKRKPILILFLFIFIFGAFRFSLKNFYPKNHISQFIDKLGNEKLHISAEVANEAIFISGKTRTILSLQKIEEIPVNGKISATFIGKLDIKFGDNINFLGKLRKLYPNNNPYSFNYKEYLEKQGICASIFAYSNSLKIEKKPQNFYSKIIIAPRKWLRNRINKLFSKKESGFLRAIILGDKGALDKELKNDFSNSGLSHILAVSGLHTGVIALIFLTLFQVILRKKNLARILTILILLYYLFLCQSLPSVNRAVTMISLVLIAKIIERKSDNLNILFAAAFIILLLNPAQILYVGFQLSFLSVFAILVFYPIFFKILHPLYNKYKSIYWLLNMMAISFSVQLFLAPLTIFYFNKIALGGILANVIAIPLLTFILPLSILTMFFPIPSINFYYVAADKFLINILFDISHFVSSKKILLFDFLNFEIWQVLGIFIVLLILILIWKERDKITKKIIYIGSSAFLIIILIFLPALLYLPKIELTILDVRTGDAIFLQTPSRKNILIDTGNKTDKIDFGEKVVFPFLQSKQIRKLDLLVLTHPHADHIGGANYLLDKIKIRSILMPYCEYNSKLYKNLCQKITEKNIEVIYADTSLVFDDFSQIKMKLLFPYFEFSSKNINNYSIILRCEYKNFSFLLTGDAEKEVEHWLCEKYDNLDIDILKVCHHGSNTSSTDEFLDLTMPEFGAISVGKFNRYGLPSDKALNRLRKHNVKFFRTDEDGAIIFSSDGEDLEIRTILSKQNFFVEKI